ncbi:MAG: hypothetical protein L3J06_03635 [Cyclobacteriaceae bacterium]|nr:hypothetical protein [Cyclobacteriaceae bacterium]
MKNYLPFLLIIAMLTISSCGSDKKEDADAFLSELDEGINAPAISEETINDILMQIPAPIEISMLMKESGSAYNRTILSNPDDVSKYNTTFKRAINLGIYGTDLIYTNIFNKNQEGLAYMKAVKELADDLNIGQFFNLRLIGRLATNNDNLDSLMLITTQNFNAINRYLQENKRANLSILFLVGGWMEAVHINCKMAIDNPEVTSLTERIGEQKIILENIMLLMSFYAETDPSIKELYEDMLVLKETYSNIKITYTYAEPTTEIVDGVLMIIDNSSSTVHITLENVKEIDRVIETIRTKLTS